MKAVSRTESLLCIPVRNPLVEEERQSTGIVMLSYPEPVKPWFSGILGRITKESETRRIKKLQLDALGTSAWDLMDGKSSVKDIIASFAKAHKLYPKEAEISVVQFLRELGRRQIIGMKQDQP